MPLRNREPGSRGGFTIEEDDFKFLEEQQKGQPGRTVPFGRNSELERRVQYLETSESRC